MHENTSETTEVRIANTSSASISILKTENSRIKYFILILAMSLSHKPGTLKQTNKKHKGKTGKGKRQIKSSQGGRVSSSKQSVKSCKEDSRFATHL